MPGSSATADRFRDLIHMRLIPGLAELGFDHRLPGSLAATEAEGVVWIIDLDVAPWSCPDKVVFTLHWGAHVPGIDEAVGDPAPEVLTVDACAASGRLRTGVAGIETRWCELQRRPRALARLADQALSNAALTAVQQEVLPWFEELRTPVDVQRHLFGALVSGWGKPSPTELRTIRRIAALSLLLGDRANAARWLDHLEVRSATTMAPDVVAERLAPLRQRLAS